MSTNDTADDPRIDFRTPPPTPGLVLLWRNHAPTCTRIALPTGGHTLTFGREATCDQVFPEDNLMSRRHAGLLVEGDELVIRDLQSKLGVFVDGARIQSAARLSLRTRHTLLLGDTLFLVEPNVDRLDARTTLRESSADLGDVVAGAAVTAAWSAAAEAASVGSPLLVHGETGTGKQNVAKVFHSRGPRPKGAFVECNCSEFARGFAESQLFGHVKGAFTDAAQDRTGYLEAADGGTLFMDEIGELDLEVQALLLKFFDNQLVRRKGGKPSDTKKVDVRIVGASHRDLHAMVAAGTFRQDLLARFGKRVAELPPLCDRPEEIPFFVELFAKGSTLAPSSTFVETCLRQTWPNNIRDLHSIVSMAASKSLARKDGKTFDYDAALIEKLLGVSAMVKDKEQARASAPPPAAPSPSAPPPPHATEERLTDRQFEIKRVRELYVSTNRNISEIARQMGISRGKVYSLLPDAGIFVPEE